MGWSESRCTTETVRTHSSSSLLNPFPNHLRPGIPNPHQNCLVTCGQFEWSTENNLGGNGCHREYEAKWIAPIENACVWNSHCGNSFLLLPLEQIEAIEMGVLCLCGTMLYCSRQGCVMLAVGFCAVVLSVISWNTAAVASDAVSTQLILSVLSHWFSTSESLCFGGL